MGRLLYSRVYESVLLCVVVMAPSDRPRAHPRGGQTAKNASQHEHTNSHIIRERVPRERRERDSVRIPEATWVWATGKRGGRVARKNHHFIMKTIALTGLDYAGHFHTVTLCRPVDITLACTYRVERA